MAGRTLHVKCATWEQVELFYTRKLRKGRILSMKVPYQTEAKAEVTLGLELPNGLVVAVDGTVLKASAIEGEAGKAGKTWIEVELTGWTEEVVARLRAMAADAAEDAAHARAVERVQAAAPAVPIPPLPPADPRRSQVPPVEELPADERALFQHLSGELRRLRQSAVHDVLGVARDAGPEDIRAGWMQQVRRHHPDLVARRGAPAITHLAEELTILANRAYDRLRSALVAEGRGVAFGPAISAGPSWLVGFDDIASEGPRIGMSAFTQPEGSDVRFAVHPSATGSSVAITMPPLPPAPLLDAIMEPLAPDAPSSVQGGEAFELRARTMLGDGDANTAQEVLAAALCVYPRSRPLRSLYYVAAALSALEKGEVMLATSQLETALAHHEECVEAAQILEHVKKLGADDTERVWKLFRKVPEAAPR